jgi:hypothetical protein
MKSAVPESASVGLQHVTAHAAGVHTYSGEFIQIFYLLVHDSTRSCARIYRYMDSIITMPCSRSKQTTCKNLIKTGEGIETRGREVLDVRVWGPWCCAWVGASH